MSIEQYWPVVFVAVAFLSNITIGILGMGNISRKVSVLLIAFGGLLTIPAAYQTMVQIKESNELRASLREISLALKINPDQSSQTIAKEVIDKIPSLFDLFEHDFNGLLNGSSVVNFEGSDGQEFHIKYQVYYDFYGQNKFLGYYIPSDPRTFEICKALVDTHEPVFEYEKNIGT